MSKKWTQERKQRQRDLINKTKPWLKSTGPRTADGKARASLNAFKHGLRSRQSDKMRTLIKLNAAFLAQIETINATNELYRKCKKLF